MWDFSVLQMETQHQKLEHYVMHIDVPMMHTVHDYTLQIASDALSYE